MPLFSSCDAPAVASAFTELHENPKHRKDSALCEIPGQDAGERCVACATCSSRGSRCLSAPSVNTLDHSDFRLTPTTGRDHRPDLCRPHCASSATSQSSKSLIDRLPNPLTHRSVSTKTETYRTMANSRQRHPKRSASVPMPRKLTKQSSSSMSSYNSEGVPLSEGKPEYLELSDEVKDLLKTQISSAVENVLDSMMHEGTEDAHWRSKMRKDDVVYYEDRESVTKGQSRFCCVSVSEASVEDVINLFLVSDTDMLLQRCRIMYDNIMDARILSVLEHPSEEHPMRSSYVRYTAFKTPALLRNHRDMCVVVATDVIHCPDGSTIGYCVWDSLNLPEVSEFDVPQGFIRSRMFRSGYFVQNNGEPGSETKVAYIVGIEAGGFAPRLATRYVMPRFGAVLSRVVGHLRRKQLDPSTFVPQSEWTDKRTAEFCQCCSKHFGAVKLLDTRRYNCVVCGDAICHACHHVEQVEVRGARNTTVGICVGCKSESRKQSRLARWSSRWGSSISTDSTESSTRSLPV